MEFNKNQTKSILKITLISILFFFFLQRFESVISGISFIWNLISVFAMGAAMAFVFNVPMQSLEKRMTFKNEKLQKIKRPLAFLITLLVIGIIIYMVLFILLPELAATFQILAVQVQQFYEKIPTYLDEIAQSWPLLEENIASIEMDWQSITQNAIKALQAAVSGLVNSSTWLISSIVSGIAKFIMSFIFSLYILFSKEKLSLAFKRLFYALLPSHYADKTLEVFSLSNKVFTNFLSGQCLEAVILGAMFVLAMSIFRMPYAVLMGVLIAVTALIPIFGAFIGCGIGVFLIFMVNPMQAVWFIVLFLVLQQLEGNLIYPKVVGNSVGLPPILVFMAVVIGGNLMGVVGMLIFIPLTSVFYTLGKGYVNHRLEAKNKVL